MTERRIEIALQDHLYEGGTTLAWLIRIDATDGTIITSTSLDQDVLFDDGTGELLFKSSIGFDPKDVDYSSGLEVDNTEMTMLLDASEPITMQKINAGYLDFAEFVLYRVNWVSPGMGKIVAHSGTTGAARIVERSIAVIELRAIAQELKTSIIRKYSLKCTARFGSMGGASCTDWNTCSFNAQSLWQSHSVQTVGEDVYTEFTADSAPSVSGPGGAAPFVPGLGQWLTGDNAGAYFDTDVVDGADIKLLLPTAYPIQASDTFRVRPDCDKTWETCKTLWQNIPDFRGHPYIPLGDESTVQTPGAQVYPLVRIRDVEIP